MTNSQTDAARKTIVSAVRKNYELQAEAMVLGDTNELDGLLDDDFTLTHMTGYVQSKVDWLADIDADRMHYDEVDNVDIVVTFEDDTPVLTARSITEATIWGTHSSWRLQLRVYYLERDGRWIAARTVASTW